MKTIKNALLGLLLAGCAVTSAFAMPTYDYEDTVFVVANEDWPGTMQSWEFGGAPDGVLAGQTFAYQFLFNTPPSAPTTLFEFWVDGANAVKFDIAEFYAFGSPISSVPGFTLEGSGAALQGAGVVDSGVYDLYLAGVFLADGAGFGGFAMDTDAPVPEPATLGLIAAGAAALLGVRRRRAKPLPTAASAC